MVEPRTDGEPERLWAGHTGRMFVVLTLGLATVKMVRRLLSPLLPSIIADLSITAVEAGLVLSIATATFALLQFPGGRIGDHLSRKTALLAGLAIVLAGTLVLAGASTLTLLVVGAAIVGVGEGLYGPPDRALLSDLFRDHRVKAFGYHTVAVDLGSVIAAGLVIIVLAVATWRTTFLPVAVVLVILAIAIYAWGRESIVVGRISLGIGETASRLVGDARLRWVIIAYSLFAFASEGFMGFLPTLLAIDHGYGPTVATLGFAVVFGAGLVTKPVTGVLSDHLPRPYIAGVGMALAAAGIAALVAAPTPGVLAAGVVLASVGVKAFPAPMQAHLMDVFPDASMGGDLGATRAVYMAAGSLGPAYVGLVASQASYSVSFAGFIACYLAAGAILVWLATTG